jgi:hypothetical protein
MRLYIVVFNHEIEDGYSQDGYYVNVLCFDGNENPAVFLEEESAQAHVDYLAGIYPDSDYTYLTKDV